MHENSTTTSTTTLDQDITKMDESEFQALAEQLSADKIIDTSTFHFSHTENDFMEPCGFGGGMYDVYKATQSLFFTDLKLFIESGECFYVKLGNYTGRHRSYQKVFASVCKLDRDVELIKKDFDDLIQKFLENAKKIEDHFSYQRTVSTDDLDKFKE